MNVTWHRILSFITIASDDVSLLAACEFCQVLLGYVFETYAHDVGESCGLPENIADFGEHQLALFLGYIPDLGVADFAILISLGGGDMELPLRMCLPAFDANSPTSPQRLASI